MNVLDAQMLLRSRRSYMQVHVQYTTLGDASCRERSCGVSKCRFAVKQTTRDATPKRSKRVSSGDRRMRITG